MTETRVDSRAISISPLDGTNAHNVIVICDVIGYVAIGYGVIGYGFIDCDVIGYDVITCDMI